MSVIASEVSLLIRSTVTLYNYIYILGNASALGERTRVLHRRFNVVPTCPLTLNEPVTFARCAGAIFFIARFRGSSQTRTHVRRHSYHCLRYSFASLAISRTFWSQTCNEINGVNAQRANVTGVRAKRPLLPYFGTPRPDTTSVIGTTDPIKLAISGRGGTVTLAILGCSSDLDLLSAPFAQKE